jgi:hypothetical protein
LIKISVLDSLVDCVLFKGFEVSGQQGNIGRARGLRQCDTIRAAAHHRTQISQGHPRRQSIDAHVELGRFDSRGLDLSQKLNNFNTTILFSRGGHGIFKIKNQDVGTALQ